MLMTLYRTSQSVGLWIGIICLLIHTGSSWAADTDKIKLGATPTGVLVWIADAQGYFMETGHDIEVVKFTSGTVTSKALLDGDIHLATSSEFAFVSRSAQHTDLRILTPISASTTARLVARADRNIKNYADLRGKKIAVTQSSIGQFFLARLLALNDVSLSDVTVEFLKPNAIVTAVTNGQVDAALTWEPNLHRIRQKLEKNVNELPNQSDQIYYFNLVGRSAWLRSNVPASAKIIKALIKAEKFARSDPAAAKQVMINKFQLEREFVDKLWQQHELRVHLPQDLLLRMEEQSLWRISAGLSDAQDVPNYLDYIFLEPMDAVDKARVGIIR